MGSFGVKEKPNSSVAKTSIVWKVFCRLHSFFYKRRVQAIGKNKKLQYSKQKKLKTIELRKRQEVRNFVKNRNLKLEKFLAQKNNVGDNEKKI